MSSDNITLPGWFGPFCAEVEAELRRLEEGGDERRPAPSPRRPA